MTRNFGNWFEKRNQDYEALEKRLAEEERARSNPVAPARPAFQAPAANPMPIANPNAKVINGYIYVPALGLYVSKQRTLQGEDWYDCHKGLLANDERMPTIPEFVEFLKYLRANPNGVKDANQSEVESIFDDILTVKSPYRAEWLDADFKLKGNKLYLNSYHELKSGKLIPRKSELLETCLMTDKQPGIDLDSWLNNPTKQGLPKTNVPSGAIWYWYPRRDNNSVSRFSAYSDWAILDCNGDPSYTVGGLGVRAIRRASP